jgi:hypothetical protein
LVIFFESINKKDTIFTTNKVRVRVMEFNATFSNISVISWRSVLLVEEISVQEKTTDMSQHMIMLYRVHIVVGGI